MSSPQYRARISKDEPLVHLSRKGSRKALRIHICRSPTLPTTLIPIARGICFSRNSNWILVEYVRGTFYIVARAGPIFIDLKPPIKLILLLIPFIFSGGVIFSFIHNTWLRGSMWRWTYAFVHSSQLRQRMADFVHEITSNLRTKKSADRNFRYSSTRSPRHVKRSGPYKELVWCRFLWAKVNAGTNCIRASWYVSRHIACPVL